MLISFYQISYSSQHHCFQGIIFYGKECFISRHYTPSLPQILSEKLLKEFHNKSIFSSKKKLMKKLLRKLFFKTSHLTFSEQKDPIMIIVQDDSKKLIKTSFQKNGFTVYK